MPTLIERPEIACGGPRGSVGRLLDLLRDAGYEPEIEPAGDVCLRNCPYDALVQEHRDVTCGMNLAWAEGVVEGLGRQTWPWSSTPSRAVAASSSTLPRVPPVPSPTGYGW